jgi:adenosylcobinamide-phosphate synthase
MAVAVGGVLDAVVGEPPTSVHPVAWLGSVVAPLDRDWRAPTAAGVGMAVFVPLGAAIPVAAVVDAALLVSPWVGGVVAGCVVFVTSSRRMLVALARTVVVLVEADVEAARRELQGLAGRDAEELSAGEVRSAAVESAAENLADGLVAPLLAFTLGALGGLPVAAGAAAWVKAVNTLDSMVGYESKPHGTASARLDDAVMWAPARVSAGLLAVVAGRPSAIRRAWAWARNPPSPNSGWPMAAIAAVLDVQLRKPGVYTLHPAGALPDAATARRGVALVSRAGWVSYVLAAGVVAWV